MAMRKSDHTYLRFVWIENKDVKVYLKVNSYVDGSVEVTITDSSDNVSYDIDLIEETNHFIRNNVMVAVKKLLKLNNIIWDGDLLTSIQKELRKVIERAKEFKGQSTVDYDRHLCHSSVVIGFYDKGPDNEENS